MNNISDLLEQATFFEATGEYAKAEHCYFEVLRLREITCGTQHPELATDLHNAALLLFAQDKYADAERLLIRELEMEERIYGPEHPILLPALEHLAAACFNLEDFAASERLYKRLIAICERHECTNPVEFANHLYSLAEICELQGKIEQASSHRLRAKEILDAQMTSACRRRYN